MAKKPEAPAAPAASPTPPAADAPAPADDLAPALAAQLAEARDALARASVERDELLPDAQLGRAMLQALTGHTAGGPTGESAVETLERIVRDRDSYRFAADEWRERAENPLPAFMQPPVNARPFENAGEAVARASALRGGIDAMQRELAAVERDARRLAGAELVASGTRRVAVTVRAGAHYFGGILSQFKAGEFVTEAERVAEIAPGDDLFQLVEVTDDAALAELIADHAGEVADIAGRARRLGYHLVADGGRVRVPTEGNPRRVIAPTS